MMLLGIHGLLTKLERESRSREGVMLRAPLPATRHNPVQQNFIKLKEQDMQANAARIREARRQNAYTPEQSVAFEIDTNPLTWYASYAIEVMDKDGMLRRSTEVSRWLLFIAASLLLLIAACVGAFRGAPDVSADAIFLPLGTVIFEVFVALLILQHNHRVRVRHLQELRSLLANDVRDMFMTDSGVLFGAYVATQLTLRERAE